VGSDCRVSGVLGHSFLALRRSWCYCRKAVAQQGLLQVEFEEQCGHDVPGRGPGSRCGRCDLWPCLRPAPHRHEQHGRRWPVVGRQRLLELVHLAPECA